MAASVPIVFAIPLVSAVSVVPYAFQSTEQGRLVSECVVDAVNEEVLPFARTDQEREPPRHDLFLHAELIVTVEQAMVAFQVDAGSVFPFGWCSGHAWFVVVFEDSYQEIRLLRVVRIYIVPG